MYLFLYRQWLEEALRENEPGSCFVFLVGTKSDLLVRSLTWMLTIISYFHRFSLLALRDSCFYSCILLFFCLHKSPEECHRTEKDALRIATEMNAEFWSVSAKTGADIIDIEMKSWSCQNHQYCKQKCTVNVTVETSDLWKACSKNLLFSTVITARHTDTFSQTQS